MVKQGDIIKVNFDPKKGHEQAGFRPAVVLSNDFFNEITKLAIICPITTNESRFPLHIPLDERTKTRGVVLCEHVRTLDLKARPHRIVEQLPKDILNKIVDIVFSEIEQI